MKRIILLLFAAVIAFSSCENLETNSPALQGQIDSIFFKANDVRGVRNDDGTVTIQGINQDKKITITIAEVELDTYLFGEGRPSVATYTDGDVEYTTAPYGQGELELSDRCISCGWLTGNFWFVAKRSEFDSLPVTVQKGVFFEASFLGENVEEGLPPVGSVTANIDNEPFEASAVTVDDTNGTIKIDGFDGLQSIQIQVPSNSVSGNYFLPRQGFSATYTIDGETFEAEAGGLVSVNFNNPETRKILIFFNFTAAGKQFTVGRAQADY